MPVYEYKCNNCEKEFEIEHSMKIDKAPSCPFCETNNEVEKLMPSSFGIAFKGKGFYCTDRNGKRE